MCSFLAINVCRELMERSVRCGSRGSKKGKNVSPQQKEALFKIDQIME